MRLFIDTDILVDIATDRQPFSDSASRLLDRIQSEHDSKLSGFLSWSSFLEFSQQVTPLVGQNKTAEFCSELNTFMRIARVRGSDLEAALAFNLPEFRATLQAAAAIACKADLIVTAQPQPFTGLRIPVQSPATLLQGEELA